MTEEQKQLPVPASPKAPAPTRIWPLWLCLIVALLLVAGASYWFQLQLSGLQNMQADLSEANQSRIELGERIARMQVLIEQQKLELNRSNKAQQQILERQQKQLEFNAKQILEMAGSSRTEWLLAEAEYLLRLANQRLNMERDIRGAVAIMQSADAVLAEVDDAGLYSIREQLVRETLSLQSIKGSDLEGLYLQFEALIDMSGQLKQIDPEPDVVTTVVTSTKTQDDTLPEWRQLLADIWRELKTLVTYHRLDNPIEPLLAPQQEVYLKQNLRLMLEQAQLGLLQKNKVTYERSINKALDWLQKYFRDSQQNQLMIEQLKLLKLANINPELPDISVSLKMLKERVRLYEQAGMPRNTVNDQPAKKPSGEQPQPSSDAPLADQ